MKKLLISVLALALALSFACASASESDPLAGYLARIADPADKVAYTLSTLEYGPLEPGDFDASIFIELLLKAPLSPVTDAPDLSGEYAVLTFPEDNVRFDFLSGEDIQNYVRMVAADGTETIYLAAVPEDRATEYGLVASWYGSLADALGVAAPIEAKMPGPGWVLDTLNGAQWADDRASLEIFLEDTDNYKVQISWGSSASETTEWVYACSYDAETQTLKAVHLICDNVTFDDDGNEQSRENVLDVDCEATFSLNENGAIVCRNTADEQLEGKVFERVPEE